MGTTLIYLALIAMIGFAWLGGGFIRRAVLAKTANGGLTYFGVGLTLTGASLVLMAGSIRMADLTVGRYTTSVVEHPIMVIWILFLAMTTAGALWYSQTD